jgi:hypothetical protein
MEVSTSGYGWRKKMMKKRRIYKKDDRYYLAISIVCIELGLNDLAKAIRDVRYQVFF